MPRLNSKPLNSRLGLRHRGTFARNGPSARPGGRVRRRVPRGDQRRPAGESYVEHLRETLEILARGAGGTDPGVLVAGVLHDPPPAAKRAAYYAETVTYLLPLAARHPWYEQWYARWRDRHADALGAG